MERPRSLLRRRRLPWLALSVLALAAGAFLFAVWTGGPLLLAGVFALLALFLWRHWERVRREEAEAEAERFFRGAPGPPSDTSPAGEGVTTAVHRNIQPPAPPPSTPAGP